MDAKFYFHVSRTQQLTTPLRVTPLTSSQLPWHGIPFQEQQPDILVGMAVLHRCAAEITQGKDLLRFVSRPSLVITKEGHLQVQTLIVTVLIFISTSMLAKKHENLHYTKIRCYMLKGIL